MFKAERVEFDHHGHHLVRLSLDGKGQVTNFVQVNNIPEAKFYAANYFDDAWPAAADQLVRWITGEEVAPEFADDLEANRTL